MDRFQLLIINFPFSSSACLAGSTAGAAVVPRTTNSVGIATRCWLVSPLSFAISMRAATRPTSSGNERIVVNGGDISVPRSS